MSTEFQRGAHAMRALVVRFIAQASEARPESEELLFSLAQRLRGAEVSEEEPSGQTSSAEVFGNELDQWGLLLFEGARKLDYGYALFLVQKAPEEGGTRFGMRSNLVDPAGTLRSFLDRRPVFHETTPKPSGSS